MSTDESSRGTVSHAHGRLDEHRERITALERWKERAMGAMGLLAFLLSVFGATALILLY